MQKMRNFQFLLLLVCVDVCLVYALRLAHLPPSLLSHPILTLWGGAVARAFVLTLFTLTAPGRWSWTGGAAALQSVAVLCFHFPAYTSVMWALGWPHHSGGLLGGHSWERVVQGYVVTAVAFLYWTHHVSSLLMSWSGWISSLMTRKSSTEETTGPMKRLLGFMRPYRWRFVAVLLLVVVSCYGEMAIPQYTGRLTDWISNEESPDAFSDAIRNMLILTIASAVLEFVCDLMYNVTMSLIHTAIHGAVFQAVLKQEIAFFEEKPTGELVSHVTTDTNDMSEALSEELSLLMWYAARFSFLLIFMVIQSWKMTLLTCMALPVISVIPKLTGGFYEAMSKEVQVSLAKANHVASQTFSNMKTVRSFANEDGETERYTRRLDETYALNKREAAAYAASNCTNSMTTMALKVLILYYGGTLVTGGNISNGGLVAFILYELQFTSSLESVMRYYPEVKKAIGTSEKIFEFLDRKPKIPPNGTLAPENLKGHVEFKNVTFSYPNNKENTLVLKDVSIEMKPGRVTALVGLNRSGKSTCLKLLERFYQPSDGEILLDGEPLQSYQDQYLHGKISVVSQECVLFARSVRENIKYGYEDASDEEMIRAAKLANVHEDIMKLSKGYDTDAGEKGGQVSGGQKQRIAIARALIRRPKVLILDNITSDLDTENEYQVYQNVLDKTNDCTVLLISKKMSVGEKADHVVVLRDGAVEEEGSHHQLLENHGHYAVELGKENKGFHRKDVSTGANGPAEVAS